VFEGERAFAKDGFIPELKSESIWKQCYYLQKVCAGLLVSTNAKWHLI